MKKLILYVLAIGLLIIVGGTQKTDIISQLKTTSPATSVHTTQPPVTSAPVITSKKETTLQRIKQEKSRVYYDGKITVSGKYTLYDPYEGFLGGQLCFDVDDKTGYLIPRELQLRGDNELHPDNRAPWFCFSNSTETAKSFFLPQSLPTPKCNYGTATVEISNYIVPIWETEAHDIAKLETVISKTPGDGC